MIEREPDHIDTFKGILLGAAMGAAFYLFIVLIFTIGEWI
jgi:hypothetical protein